VSFTPANLGVGVVALAAILYAQYRVIRGIGRTGGLGAYLATEPLWIEALLGIGCLLAAWYALSLAGTLVMGALLLLRAKSGSGPRG
jgi:hypothetical protein